MRPALALLLCAVACGPKDPDPTTSPSTGTAPLGADASLASLRVSNDSLQPAFDPGRALYAAKEGEDLRVTATPADPEAMVELVIVDRAGAEIDRVDGPVARLDLVGEQQLFVAVTSADGSATSQTQLTVLPWDFPRIDVTHTDPAPGYYFTTNMDFFPARAGLGRFRMILDNAGVPWRLERMNGIAFDFRAAPGGTSWMELGADEMVGVRARADGTRYPSFHAVDAGGDPHEMTVLANGHVLTVGTRVNQRDMTAWGGPPDAQLLDQVAQELDENGQLVFEWSAAGEVTPDELPAIAVDWSSPEPLELEHMNSIDVDPYDGNWVISLRLPSRILKVDRSTGEVLWRLGGPSSELTIVNDDRDYGWTGFAWQHSARVVGPDRVLLFDNSMNPDLPGPTGDSRYVEYQLDLAAGTATKVAEWALPDSGWTRAGGSVQRLAGGNTVIGFGNLGQYDDLPSFAEVNPDGEVVFELRLGDTEWSYRTWKFELGDDGWVIGAP